MSMLKRVLHVGCGAASPGKLHPAFAGADWKEYRLDIDPAVEPDIIASITNLTVVETGRFDAVFSSHNIEHLYPHEVVPALQEIRRVLRPDGVALITVPDLQQIGEMIAFGNLDDAAYLSALGPITPLDILFGFRPALAQGNLYMAHHTGFTSNILLNSLNIAGFAVASVQRVPSTFALWAIAFPTEPTSFDLEKAQLRMLPLHAALQNSNPQLE